MGYLEDNKEANEELERLIFENLKKMTEKIFNILIETAKDSGGKLTTRHLEMIKSDALSDLETENAPNQDTPADPDRV